MGAVTVVPSRRERLDWFDRWKGEARDTADAEGLRLYLVHGDMSRLSDVDRQRAVELESRSVDQVIADLRHRIVVLEGQLDNAHHEIDLLDIPGDKPGQVVSPPRTVTDEHGNVSTYTVAGRLAVYRDRRDEGDRP